MKIFNVENGKEKVYVQMNDMGMLNSHAYSIPASIFEKIYTDIVIIDDHNRMDFVSFDQPHEVDFFASLDWIVDYKELGPLSLEELVQRAEELEKKIDAIVNKYNAMSKKEQRKNMHLVKEFELLEYKYKYYIELIYLKRGKSNINIPIVPDSNGFKFSGDENCLYEVSSSLDHNSLLVYRKDGKKLTETDTIPYGFLQSALSIAILEQSGENSFSGDYEMKKRLSEDNKYFIIEFKTKSYSSKREEKKKEKIGIKEYFKRFIKPSK